MNNDSKPITCLKDTVSYMNSDDYKSRFFAEYWQLRIRCEKLERLCIQIEAEEMTGKKVPYECSLSLLQSQLNAMKQYLHILGLRAFIEDIHLSAPVAQKPACDPDIDVCQCYTAGGRCMGTREIDPVSCGGDRMKCIYESRKSADA